MLLGRLYKPRLVLALGYANGPRRAFPDATNTTKGHQYRPPYHNYDIPTSIPQLQCLRDRLVLIYVSSDAESSTIYASSPNALER